MNKLLARDSQRDGLQERSERSKAQEVEAWQQHESRCTLQAA